ncbi:DHH family phosphoesterase [Salinispira pacifica]|uniref:Kef-type K+ transport systems (NAD-binding component fused to exopolyphosphatase domain) n=1 Tax=Salinispira pacifica TaxID=1307761 RepID=V5WCN9_9SPIO|nr:DHH family phosphoesterase [Salinispira pacifica]AHC13532.1 Kef-type K+ transport systems (NAD-binding component fused to exopolyphosphatase domain) [Salinispira pacifica]
MNYLNKLVSSLDPSRRVVIQVHDFPDHDAVASGFGLMRLLEPRDFRVELCYTGRIESNSLSSAVEQLEIPLVPSGDIEISDHDQLIIVDGFVGNRNVSELPGEIIGLIDHHSPPEKPTTPFFDIREEIGSCSTIIYDYYHESGLSFERNVATALLMGLMMDTAFMTRGVTRPDMKAFSELFFLGDWETGSRLLRNSLSLQDLQVFREAINSCEVADDFAFVPVEKECSPEVMAITADFFLGLQEIRFVVVLVPDRDEYRISVRSEDLMRPSDLIIRKALRGVGYGGGHVHMGGGNIPRDLFPGQKTLRNRFIEAMGQQIEVGEPEKPGQE